VFFLVINSKSDFSKKGTKSLKNGNSFENKQLKLLHGAFLISGKISVPDWYSL
jgi:hypothetical protein